MKNQTETTSSTALASDTPESSSKSEPKEKTLPAQQSEAPTGTSKKSPDKPDSKKSGISKSSDQIIRISAWEGLTCHLKRKVSEDDDDVFYPYSDPSELNEPETRLFLLEKGRIEGIAACNGGHRSENHQNVSYEVTRAVNDVKLLKVEGAVRSITAKGTTRALNSKIAVEQRTLDGLNFAMKQEHSDEVKDQLSGKIISTKSVLMVLRAELESYKDTPDPVTTIRYFKV